MDNNPLIEQVLMMKQSLFYEGILDGQFNELEKLDSDENPNFVEDTINVYFEETKQALAIVDNELAKGFRDVKLLNTILYKLKGSSASIGANKVKVAVERAINVMEQGKIDASGFRAVFGPVKWQSEILEAQLGAYLQLLKKVRDAK